MKIFNACPTGKVAYLDDIDAALSLEQRQILDRGERNYYCCGHCSLWHLTSGELEE